MGETVILYGRLHLYHMKPATRFLRRSVAFDARVPPSTVAFRVVR